MMANPFDIFEIARKVTDCWLDTETGDARAAVLRALSGPQDGGKGKAERRLTVGWFVAHPRGGWHRLDAVTRRTAPGVVRGETMEAVIGTDTIREPHVVLKLAKAGVRASDFAVSYGDQLRIGEAGRGVTLVDLRRIRALMPLLHSARKPEARPLREAQRALQARRLGLDAEEPDPAIAAAVADASEDELRYAVRCATLARSKQMGGA